MHLRRIELSVFTYCLVNILYALISHAHVAKKVYHKFSKVRLSIFTIQSQYRAYFL